MEASVSKIKWLPENISTRNGILGLEEQLKYDVNVHVGDNELCPLKHSFSDGIYVREIFIPKGTILTGKIHKHDHPNFLMSGKVEIITEFGGHEVFEGPKSMISQAGTKRAVHALEDCVWITVHHNPTNATDLKDIEKHVIADTYKDYDKFKNKQLGIIKRLIKWISR